VQKERRKKSLSLATYGGGFVGFMLAVALSKIVGKSIFSWIGLLLMFICITVGVAFEIIDERKVKPDIVVRKKSQSEDERER
jgi:high-affinity Fe2+/Pb2+ permease